MVCMHRCINKYSFNKKKTLKKNALLGHSAGWGVLYSIKAKRHNAGFYMDGKKERNSIISKAAQKNRFIVVCKEKIYPPTARLLPCIHLQTLKLLPLSPCYLLFFSSSLLSPPSVVWGISVVGIRELKYITNCPSYV